MDHLIIDCMTGEQTVRPMTEEELRQKGVSSDSHAAAKAKETERRVKREADLALLKASDDPAIQALARLLDR